VTLKAPRQLLHLALGPFYFIALAAAPVAAMPYPVRASIGLLLWMAWWWVFQPVHLAVTGFLPLAVLAVFNFHPVADILPAYSQQLVVLLIGANILATLWNHCGQDRDAMIQRALSAGVRKMMLPNIDIQTINPMWDLTNKFPQHCLPMMGLHPCSIKEDYQDILDEMKKAFAFQSYIGVGETGIDLYWDTTFRKQQVDAFEQQISWAKEFDLPVIIHSREAIDLTIEIISQHQEGSLKGIFHCFGGDVGHIRKIEQLGFMMGIGGVVTFKKGGLAELLPHIPLELMVLETDAPYLAPSPYRGKRNESAYLLLIANRIATGLNIGLEELSRITSGNAERVYGKKD
jgi:TatD DNase family protein